VPPALRPERLLVGIGVILLASYGVIRLHSVIASRVALARTIQSRTAKLETAKAAQPVSENRISFVLWSEKRIRAYGEALALRFDPPLGVLTIPEIDLTMPVFNGTDDLTLNRGVGRIIGTGHPGTSGNAGIAGHRDGFFRGLKDIQVGDEVEFKTADHVFAYRVSAIEIVTPDNVRVLEDTRQPSLTLVTCYPFYFVGDAPQRYIVHCSLKERKPAIGNLGRDVHN
jgi:sortase A